MSRRLMFKPLRYFVKRFCTATETTSWLYGSPVELSYSSYETTVGKGGNSESPLFIMHGLMGSKTNWHSLAKAFSNTGRKVVCVDARNHGESPHTSEMDYFLLSKDILTLMDEMGHDKVSLLGHSMGGKVAMCTSLLSPDRVDNLVVVDVSPISSPRFRSKLLPEYLQEMLRIQVNLIDLPVNDTPISTARIIASNMLKDIEKDPDVRTFLTTNLIIQDGRFRWRVNLDSIINNYMSLCQFPVIKSQYGGPTLFIGGAKSDYITPTCVPVIEKLFPNSEVKYISGAGHWVHADKPSEFIRTVKDFYNEIDAL